MCPGAETMKKVVNVGLHMTDISVLKIHMFTDDFKKVIIIIIIIIIVYYSRRMTWSHLTGMSVPA